MDYFKLKKEEVLILDFDGTMCRLFKNYDLASVVKSLQIAMRAFGVDFSLSSDAFDVFAEVVRQVEDPCRREEALSFADNILTKAEIEAAETGDPVPGVEAAMSFLYRNHYRVGISTNNSEACVRVFLGKYCQAIPIPVIGRHGTKPELMKPNTWSLKRAIGELAGDPGSTIFIGDTERDYQCALKVGCRFWGMAPTEKKREKLSALLSEERLLTDYYDLLQHIQ